MFSALFAWKFHSMLPVFRLSTDFHPLNCKLKHLPERRAQTQGDFLKCLLLNNSDELLSSLLLASFGKINQSKNVLSHL